MSQQPPSTGLETARNGAQFFTMGAAIAYAIWWIIEQLAKLTAAWAVDVGDVFIACTCVGGVVMGVLYAIHRRSA